MSGVGIFFIVLVVLALLAAVGWVVFTQLRARRLGLPQPTLQSYNPFSSSTSGYGGPTPAPGGVVGWVNDKVRAFKNRNNRTAGGAYEEPLSSSVRGRASNRGFGPLDPDEAWDARVGTEADAYGPGGFYEEQELGLHSGEHNTAYSGGGYTPGAAPAELGENARGRSISREPEPYIGGSKAGLDRRYDEAMGKAPAQNPFGDEAEASNVSLRGVSPRPMEADKGHSKQPSLEVDDSPTERRSMFREAV